MPRTQSEVLNAFHAWCDARGAAYNIESWRLYGVPSRPDLLAWASRVGDGDEVRQLCYDLLEAAEVADLGGCPLCRS